MAFALSLSYAQKVKKETKKQFLTKKNYEKNYVVNEKSSQADYVYSVNDIFLDDGSETSVTLSVSDDATIGMVNMHYEWTTDLYSDEGSFTVTSPEGTEATIGMAQESGEYSINLFDFSGENLTGDWIFTIYDSYGDGGHSATNITFNVFLPATEPIADINFASWDFGQIQNGLSSETNSFVLTNIGIGQLTVTSITDLTGSDFSTSFQLNEINLNQGEQYTFVFTYTPSATGPVSDTVIINTNGGEIAILLTGEGILAADENFESGTIPDNWTIIDNDGDGQQWEAFEPSVLPAHSGNWVAKVSYNSNGNDDWLILPKLVPETSNSELSFWAASSSDYYLEDIKVMLSTTGNAIGDFTTELGSYSSIANEWTNFSFDLSSYNNTEIYVAVVCVSVDQLDLYVDDIYAPVQYPDNDLAAQSVSGDVAPVQDSISVFTVTVKNNGKLTQTDYLVKLVTSTGVVLDSVSGVSIEPKMTASFNLEASFATEGTTNILGLVELSTDENTSNNETAPFTVYVQPPGTVTLNVGTGNEVSNALPANFYFQSSLSEVIYYPDEINMGGTVKAIDYYNNFKSNLTNKPLRIWMGETETENLDNMWIPSSELALVYDNTVDLPSGENIIHIQLETPYVYYGGKLVIMVERPLDTVYYSYADYFYATETLNHPKRAIYYISDTDPADPENPSAGFSLDYVPNTRFYFDVSGMGSIVGNVVDTSSTPLPDAEISLTGTFAKTVTDEAGNYNFPYVFENTYSLKAVKHGFIDTVKSITVTENDTLTADFIMLPLPTVTVSGKVAGSDAPTVGLIGASIEIGGYEDYLATTDSSGNYSVPSVYSTKEYVVIISYSGYETFIDTINTLEDDIVLNAVLNEIPIPASNVVASITDAEEAVITWNPPGSGVEAQYVLDDGTAENGWTINPGFESWLGNKFEVDDAGSITSFEIFAQENAGSGEEEITIDVFDSEQNLVGTSDPFILVAENWVTVNIENVEFNGNFYAMIHWNNLDGATNYVGFDEDGEHANENLDMYYDGSAWSTIHEAAGSNPGVFLMRANVLITGNANKRMASYPKKNVKVNVNSIASSNKSSALVLNEKENPVQSLLNYSKSLETYTIFRLVEGFEDSVSTWVELANSLTDTSYTDVSLLAQNDGMYRYAVKAIYTNSVISKPTFSNTIPVGMEVKLTFNITTNAGDAEGAEIKLTNEDGSEDHIYSNVAPNGGITVFENVWKGTYSISITKDGFKPSFIESVNIMNDSTFSFQLDENIISPFNLSVEVDGTDALFSWNNSGNEMFDDFESYDDFALSFSPWTVVDVDLSDTYGFNGIDFPNAGVPMSFIIFNPESTTPPMNDTEGIQPHSGKKFVASFAAQTPPNNDWLITKSKGIASGDILSFWAKTFVADYGLERFKVGVSTTGTNPDDFEIISGAGYLEAPAEAWTEYTFDLSSYAGETVYVGIQCVSNDAFIFMVDDVFIGPLFNKNNKEFTEYNVYINDLENPIASTTNTNYSFSGLVEGQTYTAGVSSVYTSGESEIMTIEFDVPVGINEVDNLHSLIVYPNPAKDKLQIISGNRIDKVKIFDAVGNLVLESKMAEQGINVSGLNDGIYIMQIISGDKLVTKRISIIR